MPSVAQGDDITLTGLYYDEFLQPTDPTTPLIDILNPSGTVVINDAVPTKIGTGQYEYIYSVPAGATISALWKIRWYGVVDGVELGPIEEFFEVTVGEAGAPEVYFTVEEAKELAGMSSISDDDIIEARERIEELIEKKAGIAFVSRTRTVTLSGRATDELTLGDWFIRSVVAVSTRDGSVSTSYDSSALANVGFGSRRIYRQDGTVFPWGTSNITVTYTYGMDEPPAPVKRAALLMCQASFVLVDAEGNPTRPLSSVLLEIPEVKELLEPYMHKNTAYSIQVGS